MNLLGRAGGVFRLFPRWLCTVKLNVTALSDFNLQKQSEVFCEKDILKNLENSQENTSARVTFLIKLQALRPVTASVFSFKEMFSF